MIIINFVLTTGLFSTQGHGGKSMYLMSFKGKTCPKIGHLPPDQFHEKFHKRLKNN